MRDLAPLDAPAAVPAEPQPSAEPNPPESRDAPAARSEPVSPIWAGDAQFEIADEPPKESRQYESAESRRYFTLAVAIVSAVGALLGILAG